MKGRTVRCLMIAALLSALTGCAAGLQMGQHWEKPGASQAEYDAAITDCVEKMKVQPVVYDTDFSMIKLVPGHSLVNLNDDITARKKFSRDCMMAQGWAVK